MPGGADDEVIVQRDAERRRRLLDLARHLDIGLGRGRVARGVVWTRIMPKARGSLR